ncbi:MAG: tRNA adenosine(34) deaminase TadA [Bacteriovoracia bacterium]
MNFSVTDHLWFMSMALEQAELAYKAQEVPVGAVLVSPNGDVLSKQYNLKESQFNPTAHAEILALTEGAKKLQNWRLSDCVLYVTLEPCPMCLTAMVQSRVRQCVFGAYDSKGGALSLGYHLHQDKRLNHQFSMIGGIKHFECSRLLSQFFKERRTGYRPKN